MVEVVAALIWDKDKFLICQRPANKARALLWEFVGGKVERGETKEQALIRECKEELNITLSVRDVFMEVVHEYPDITVHLTLFNAKIDEGVPQKLEHNDIKWITPEEIPNYNFCPADEEILKEIKNMNKKQKRDNFTEPVRRKAAQRVAYRCSFPGCGVPTIGPKHGDALGVASVGQACHICAAAVNGPRYDATMTEKERKSIENCIWMCDTHAKFYVPQSDAKNADSFSAGQYSAEAKDADDIDGGAESSGSDEKQEKFESGSQSSSKGGSKVHLNFGEGFVFNVEDGKDKVHISKEGIHISDGKDEVHIGGGIHIINKDGHRKYSTDTDAYGVNVSYADRSGSSHQSFTPAKNGKVVYFFRTLPYPIIALIVYLLLGFQKNLWHPAWIIFLTIPLYYSTIEAFAQRKMATLSITLAVVIAYLCLGFFGGLWHPGWLIFLVVPLFQWTAYVIKNKFALDAVYPLFCVVFYLAMGFFKGLWHPAWIIFLTIPVFSSIVHAVKRRPNIEINTFSNDSRNDDKQNSDDRGSTNNNL